MGMMKRLYATRRLHTATSHGHKTWVIKEQSTSYMLRGCCVGRVWPATRSWLELFGAGYTPCGPACLPACCLRAACLPACCLPACLPACCLRAACLPACCLPACLPHCHAMNVCLGTLQQQCPFRTLCANSWHLLLPWWGGGVVG
jgi:hypothetical protein